MTPTKEQIHECNIPGCPYPYGDDRCVASGGRAMKQEQIEAVLRDATPLDIRDFETGQTYYVITSDERGGRCVMNGMFIAAWESKQAAKDHAKSLGTGFHVVKQVKVGL